MNPPAYFEPPPGYDEELENLEKGKEKVEENSKETKENTEKEGEKKQEGPSLPTVIIMVIIMWTFMNLVTARARKEAERREQEDSRHDQIFRTKDYLRLFVDGNETVTVNGTQLINPAGRPEYRVTLPSFNVSWSEEDYQPHGLLFSLYVEGEEPRVETVKDVRPCEGNGTWCNSLVSSHKIATPIIVEYTVIYKFPDYCEKSWFSFNRTFHIDQWRIQG